MARTDPFDQPRRRLKRARQHLSDLTTEIQQYSRSPYGAIEASSDGVHKTWRIKFKPTPPVCDDLTFEVLFTLRAALDQAAYAAVTALGEEWPKMASFPIADTPEAFEKKIGHRNKQGGGGLPHEIKELFRRFKPYRAGNEAIWILKELRDRVHTSLVPVAIAGMRFGSSMPEPGKMNSYNSRWGPRDELIVKGSGSNVDIKAIPVIGFDQPDLTGSKAATTVLRAALREVQKIVTETEKRCRELRSRRQLQSSF
jgi:hypothetical protein